MNRRSALAAIGGIVISGSGLAALASEDTHATSLSMGSLDVPNHSRSVANSVAAVQLSTTGDYKWSTSVDPTRAVLRLEVDCFNEQSQIDATTLTPLEPETSGSYTLSGNLLSHPRITQADVTPNEGETARIELGVSVSLAVYSEGEVLGESKVRDDAVLEVADGKASIDIGVSGEGSLSVETSSQ